MVTLTLNGEKVKAKEGTTLLELCQKQSISIPTLCYHPDLVPHGSCRLCTVEVSENKKTRLVTACNYPVREGIKVETHSERVLQSRRFLIELLLARCPHVSLIQEFAREMGIKESPYQTENPENRCILCGLCVRACNEMVGAHAIGFSKRGTLKKIGTPFEIDSERCIACGACESICPTGAVSMEMDRVRKMKQLDTGILRTCRYMRLGLVNFMVCSNGFECWRCEFDQMMEDRFETNPAMALQPAKAKQPFELNGFTFFPELFYSKEHLWAKPVESHIRLGFDDLISILMTKADSIHFPAKGTALRKGEVLTEITASGKRARILSPLSGVISWINSEVKEFPNLAWRDPYRRGWLLMIQSDHPEEIYSLYSGDKAKAWFKQQALNLTALFKKWVSNPSKKINSHDGQWLRGMVQDHWDELAKMLLND